MSPTRSDLLTATREPLVCRRREAIPNHDVAAHTVTELVGVAG